MQALHLYQKLRMLQLMNKAAAAAAAAAAEQEQQQGLGGQIVTRTSCDACAFAIQAQACTRATV